MMMDIEALRTALMVPLADLRFIAKAHQRGADAIVLDLEDGVPPDRKEIARGLIGEAIKQLRTVGASVMVRVNPAPELLEADLSAVARAGVDTILLPKVDSLQTLQALEPLLLQVETVAGLVAGTIRIVAMIESPQAVMGAAAIAQSERVVALLFGNEDYCASLGVSSTTAELDWPAQQIAVAARAADCAAFGIPGSITGFNDAAKFEHLVRRARNMGFTGCICIHPLQVGATARAFAPSEQEVAAAQAILQIAESSDYRLRGVVDLDGQMIDAPVVAQARATVRNAAVLCTSDLQTANGTA